MLYTEHSPDPPLNQFVEKIWYCYAENFRSACLTVPLPNHELVFNFSDHYAIRKAGDQQIAITDPVAWVNGLQSKAYFSQSSGRHEMLGVFFKANGLKAFVKDSSADFTDNFTHARLVFGDPVDVLINRLQETVLVRDKIALTEKFLLAHLTSCRQPAYLHPALTQLSSIPLVKGYITGICDQLSISNKSLIHAFKKHIGLTPARYAQVQLINKAIGHLAKRPGQSLTQLAHELNFFDQSHFINLFKAITSLTPSQYAWLAANQKLDAASPNFIIAEG